MPESPAPKTALVGAGSNLGDRLGHLQAGLHELHRLPGVRVAVVSRVYHTAPWGYADQPDFLNLVAVLETTLPPLELLEKLKAVETLQGRTRDGPRYGPRTLDLDLLFVGQELLDSPTLTLPHPRWRERSFVVWPLRDLLRKNSLPRPLGWAGLKEELQTLDVGPEPLSEPFPTTAWGEAPRV